MRPWIAARADGRVGSSRSCLWPPVGVCTGVEWRLPLPKHSNSGAVSYRIRTVHRPHINSAESLETSACHLLPPVLLSYRMSVCGCSLALAPWRYNASADCLDWPAQCCCFGGNPYTRNAPFKTCTWSQTGACHRFSHDLMKGG